MHKVVITKPHLRMPRNSVTLNGRRLGVNRTAIRAVCKYLSLTWGCAEVLAMAPIVQ
jgi:hypothetical protein